jgi:uncharacterized damage-inducible protein DinB
MFSAYNEWANELIFDAAEELSDAEYRMDCGAFFKSMLGTLNHILAADRIWLNRFTGSGDAPTRLDTILFEDLPDLGSARKREDQRIKDWINTLSADSFDEPFTYTPITDPRTVTQRLGPALAHFFNHQTHHRGQAHMILTSLGKAAPPIDLIYFLRTADGEVFT